MVQQVCLMNPQNVKQKVVVGVVSGFRGTNEFYFKTIPDLWLKVHMKEVVCPNTAFMYPHKGANESVIKDDMDGNALWKEEFIRKA